MCVWGALGGCGRPHHADIMPTLALANAVGGATASRRGAGRNVATAAAVQSLLEEAARHAPTADRRRHATEALAILRATAGPAVAL
jgi:hypothetical protein